MKNTVKELNKDEHLYIETCSLKLQKKNSRETNYVIAKYLARNY